MADPVLNFASKHAKLLYFAIAALFSVATVFATVRSNADDISKHGEDIREMQKSIDKIEAIADDVRIIKNYLLRAK